MELFVEDPTRWSLFERVEVINYWQACGAARAMMKEKPSSALSEAWCGPKVLVYKIKNDQFTGVQSAGALFFMCRGFQE